MLFDSFWEHYPKRTNRKRALEVWATMTAEDQQKAVEVIPELGPEIVTDDGPKYTPMAWRWLEGERWNDELPETPEPSIYDRDVIDDSYTPEERAEDIAATEAWKAKRRAAAEHDADVGGAG